MKIINAGFQILTNINGMEMLKAIEYIARTCYKSENSITELSAVKMVENLIRSGHEAMLEHQSISVKFIVDRGVSHELVRHRMASYAQENTRYCNYSKDKFGNEITVIKPCFLDEDKENYRIWKSSCEAAEKAYFATECCCYCVLRIGINQHMRKCGVNGCYACTRQENFR